MEGVLLRSKKTRWVAEGEKITKYFCNLEKRHYVSKNMAKLIDKDGNVITNNKDILKEVSGFYETLYKEKTVEDGEIADLVNDLAHLSNDEANTLEGEITLNEASQVLKKMKHSKGPGTDGFTAEFF